jgi:hypothetical protein
MLSGAVSSYPVMHAVVLMAAAIAAVASVGMRGRFSAAFLFASSVATIIVSGRDLLSFCS